VSRFTFRPRGIALAVIRSARALLPSLALSCAALLPAAAQPTAPSALLPVDAFFKPAALRSPSLSPSGRWLAVLTSVPGKRVGFLMIDLEGGEQQRFIEAAPNADVMWFQWVGDDWLIFGLEEPGRSGSDRRGPGLMSMKRDGSESKQLIRRSYDAFVGTDEPSRRRALQPNHIFVGTGAPGSREIILEEWIFDVRGEYSHSTPKVLDVATMSLRTMLKDAPRSTSMLLDGQGRARVLINDRDGQVTMYWSDDGNAPWRQISKAARFESTFWPSYVDDAGNLIVEIDTGTGGELRRLDLTTGKTTGDAIIATPGFEPGISPKGAPGSGKVSGISLTVDAETTVWFEPEMQRIQADIDAKLPGRVNVLSCRPCDKPRVVLIHSYSDVQPGEFLVYRPEKGQLLGLGPSRPDIDPRRMSRLEFHRTKARDGRDLPVWITRPVAAATAGKAAPAVVMVHGGPWVRGNEWEWNAEAQFLASRGYVVIEPEFRGSRGYGDEHFRAGFKQWGLTMQDDVSDALKFAVDKGWAEAGKACIVGGSYGGYATLMGLAKDPDQYRCGAAFMAVADQRFMFSMHWSDVSQEARKYGYATMLGDPDKEEARFIATSPLEQVARIKAPVLLVHGKLDRRVPIQNGERMRDALVKNGKKVEWVTYDDEGHWISLDANRVDFWRRVETFLGSHLK
jgi:dipeptidyl aminopeptidase/acylaminoacyl peptidase